MFPRLLDLAVLGLAAFAVLLPRADVKVQPGLQFDSERRLRVAELEAALEAKPGDPEATLELADLLVDARRPDWALGPVAKALVLHPKDHRLHSKRGVALADHFEAGAAYESVQKALELCESGSSEPCTDPEHSRLVLLRNTLAKVRDIDMRADPNTAKERILKALRPAHIPGSK